MGAILAKPNTISSTDKLLDLIRNKKKPKQKSESAGRPSPPSPSSKGFDLKSSLAQIVPFKKKITVGVTIGYKDLLLVKIGQSSEKKHYSN